MAAPFGLSASGFRRKTDADIRLELEESYRGEYGLDINLQADSLMGRQVDVFAEREASIWEMIEAVYQSPYRDSAEGVALDQAAANTDHTRLPARTTTVTLTLGGTPGTSVAAGKIVSRPVTADKFVTLATVVIAGGGTVDVAAESQDEGAIDAPAGTITQIDTPVTGWATVTNALDGDLGREIEVDAFFRKRINESLQVIGAATVEAIRSKIIQEVDGVTDAFVFENDTDAPVSGRPAHSFEAVVIGGSDADILAKLWEVKAAGIVTYGTTIGLVADSMGYSHTVKFTRGTDKPVWFYLDLTVTGLFNTGVKQQETVEVTTATSGATYTVTVNGIPFIYVAGGADTVITIATALVGVINAGTWVSVTAADNGGGTFTLEADEPGNAFSLSVGALLEISVALAVANAGNQADVTAAIIEFAEGDNDTPAEQVIGADVILGKYNAPIFSVANITGAVIYIADAQPTGDPTAVPGDWQITNLAIADSELATFDTTRTTVRVTVV